MYEMFASKEEIYVLLGFITSVKKMMQPNGNDFHFILHSAPFPI